ncbi:hypothetical protein NP233_g7587 [Leucocoprinus birnbaumii]|uniref:Pre-rRNA-processing protein TSR2 n=1 Tax=Leucocoprinus birnbaumii TaxID=56174 RepID=A0AAD5VUE7_9AGAR|nr:hypothetical protein NP233_g7587 [Leucocoprinus birnbaumii]
MTQSYQNHAYPTHQPRPSLWPGSRVKLNNSKPALLTPKNQSVLSQHGTRPTEIRAWKSFEKWKEDIEHWYSPEGTLIKHLARFLNQIVIGNKRMSTSEVPTAPTPQTILFARGVIARLAIWSTLRIAVQENWGGPDAKRKPSWIASTIVDSFEEEAEQPDEQYIEEMLLQIMADEFEAVLEDDSAASVAKDIVRMYLETREGKDETVLKFEGLADKIKGRKIEVKENVESDDEDWGI